MVRAKRQGKEAEKPRRVSSRAHPESDVIVAVEDQKRIGGVEHFLVKWSASSKKDSWEPGSEVKKVAKSLIDEFQLKQKEGEDEEYEIEKLVDRKRHGKTVKYLVKWKGFTSENNTWELESELPAININQFEKQYGKLAPKREKLADDTDAGDEDVDKETPKKKAKKSPVKPTKQRTTDISIVQSRKLINDVLHYEVKFVGQASFKIIPIFEIEDLQAIVDWERESYAVGVSSIEEDEEFTVEKIIAREGDGKNRKYRVKWLGYPNNENTWEKLENLGSAKKIVAEFDKIYEERAAKLAEKDYEVERIVDEKLIYKKTHYLVKWKNYKAQNNTWEPEVQLKETASHIIDQWQAYKVKRAEKRELSRQKREEKKEKKKAEREAAKAEKKTAKESEKKIDETTEEADEPQTAE